MDASADAAKVKYLDHVIPAGILTEANHGVTFNSTSKAVSLCGRPLAKINGLIVLDVVMAPLCVTDW